MSKKLSFIGLGRLGLCTALCFEKAGFDIVGVDVFPGYVDSINNKTLKSGEPRVEELLKKSKNLKATTKLTDAVNHSDILFILVATPTGIGENAYDCGVLSKVLRDLNALKLKNKHIIICATVLPGYIANVGLNLIEDCVNCTLNYNPEFIAQGDIIKGLLNPDVVLIGEFNKKAGDLLQNVYEKMVDNKPRIARMSCASAEIMKLSLNCFVTTKVSFANYIGDIADSTEGADKNDILKAIGADSRVGSKYLKPGYGYGGPCFPRDNRALGLYASSKNIKPLISEATDQYNNFHADFMVEQLINQNLDTYIITDVAYKSKCPVDIIEESQPLEVAKKLSLLGKKVIIRDRAAIVELVKRTYGSKFEYQVDDELFHDKTIQHGQIMSEDSKIIKNGNKKRKAVSQVNTTMNNPLSSYSR